MVLAVSGSAQSVSVGSNQIEAFRIINPMIEDTQKASEEKQYFARRRYTDREQGERNKTLILTAFALGHVENTEERCRKRREINLGTRLENCWCTHTHTILSLMTDS